jgi:dolichol-phosphate mannosyltransferase
MKVREARECELGSSLATTVATIAPGLLRLMSARDRKRREENELTDNLPELDSRSDEAKRRALIIVPTYNECSSLPVLVKKFFVATPETHMLVVDDSSPDGTAAVCTELMKQHPNLHLLERREDRGLGRAYIAGMRYALAEKYEIVGTMDADMSHDPMCLPGMLELARSHDVVIGSRYIRDGGTINWQIRRILLSWLANKFAAQLLGMTAHDLTSGFRLYRATSLEKLDLDQTKSTGYSFLVEVLHRLQRQGARIGESPIIYYDRTMGKSKLARREIYLGAWNLLRLKFSSQRDVARSHSFGKESRL